MNQYTYLDLESMRNIDPAAIPDSRDIKVDIDKPLLERALDYIDQGGNFYFMRCGNIIAKIEHSETETTINDCVAGFFRSFMRII